MTYVITEPCIDVKDTACVDVCPVDCIHPTSDSDDFENQNQLFIDPMISMLSTEEIGNWITLSDKRGEPAINLFNSEEKERSIG